MSRPLDRAGIFKGRPFSWEVQQADSGAVAVAIGFEAIAQYNGDGWDDWGEYETHHCYGSWWVVKKTGEINQAAVDQLATCLGWNGRLGSVAGAPPDIVVQIKVEEDTYKGTTRYKAGWMNPEDFTPNNYGASPDEVRGLEARFGSLLRAAAAGAAKAKPNGGSKPPPAAAPPATERHPDEDSPPFTDEDIPF
jgi:hypothetical protein